MGRELLRGRIVDSNARNLARQLTQRGAVVRRITVVDDDEQSISSAVREALERDPHLVVTTGGLGPAEEDRTLAGMGDALALPLALDHQAKLLVEGAYQRLRQRKFVTDGGMTAIREKICTIPVGAEAVVNPVGISPGIICRLAGGAAVLCLPGMPDEMQAVLEEALPLLKIVPSKGQVAQREIESPTADESALAPLLDRLAAEFPEVWIHSRPAGSRKSGARIVIRVETSGPTQREADTAIDEVVKRLLALATASP